MSHIGQKLTIAVLAAVVAASGLGVAVHTLDPEVVVAESLREAGPPALLAFAVEPAPDGDPAFSASILADTAPATAVPTPTVPPTVVPATPVPATAVPATAVPAAPTVPAPAATPVPPLPTPAPIIVPAPPVPVVPTPTPTIAPPPPVPSATAVPEPVALAPQAGQIQPVAAPAVTNLSGGPARVSAQIPDSAWRWLHANGWRIEWRQGPGPARVSEAQYVTSTIVIWYDANRSDAFWLGAFGHELGHAVSYRHFGTQQMNEWNAQRDLTSWRWVPGTPNDFSVGEGDFAEAFMSYLFGHRIRSAGGPLTQQHRAWIAANTPF